MNKTSTGHLIFGGAGLWLVAVAWNVSSFEWKRVLQAEYRPRTISLPQPAIVKQLSMGFAASLADLYWIGAAHYFGEPRYHDVAYYQLHEYIDIINELAPDFHEPYAFAGAAIPWNTGTDWVNVDQAVQVLRRGIARFPDDWRLHFFLAYDLGTYLGRYEEAGAEMIQAAHSPHSPRYLLELSARYLAEGGGLDRAEALTSAMLESAPDDNTREVMHRHLQELQVERDLQAIEVAVRAYRVAHDEWPPALDAPDLHLPRSLGTYRDPVGDPYEYNPVSGEVRSRTLERFRPYGLKKP